MKIPGHGRFRAGLLAAAAAPAAAQPALDIAYGPAARHRLDVFPPAAGCGSRSNQSSAMSGY